MRFAHPKNAAIPTEFEIQKLLTLSSLYQTLLLYWVFIPQKGGSVLLTAVLLTRSSLFLYNKIIICTKESIAMKRLTAFLLILTLCLSLTACSGTGNPDQDYVLALMEKGDYDMAIQVLENLRAKSGAATNPASVPDVTDALTEPPTEPVSTLTDTQQLVVETVTRFMEETGNTWVQQFENEIGNKARPVTVSHAAGYLLEDWEDFDHVDCLMIRLDMDWLVFEEDGSGACFNSMYILLDKDTDVIYNGLMPKKTNGEFPIYDTVDALMPHILGSYESYITFGTDCVWSSEGILKPLAEEEIQIINKVLEQ